MQKSATIIREPRPIDGPARFRAGPGRFAWLLAGYGAAWFVTAALFQLPSLAPLRLFGRYVAVFLITFACYCGIAAILLRKRDPLRLSHALAPDAIARATSRMVACAALLAVFTSFKCAIPALHPFAWDVPLAALDRFLHRADAWVLIAPLLQSTGVLALLSIVYGPLWFLAGAAVLSWASWLRDPAIRRHFFLAYAALWIVLGTAAAIVLSSAGPAYFHLVEGGDDSFLPLLRALRAHAPWVTELHETLWRESTLGSGISVGAGISAAPSMHVAQLAFFALVFRRVHRKLALVFALLTVVTTIATVALAWHYAVDAYMGVLGAVAIDVIVFRMVSRRQARSLSA
jgi:hypothetical protein